MITFWDYGREKILVWILNLFGMIFLSGFLFTTGNPRGNILLILCVWGTVLFSYFGVDYLKRRNYYIRLEKLLDGLTERYLIGEVMEEPIHMEDRIYRQVLRRASKSSIETIRRLEEEQKDYREYVEAWIHEVKGPITLINLMSEKQKDSMYVKLQAQLSLLNNYIDMALFYARAGQVYKDFVIKQVDLEEAVISLFHKNKQLFLENKVNAELHIDGAKVPGDEKWIQFVINQILLNCVKYKKEGSLHIKVTAKQEKDFVVLIIEDDGIGIKKQEIERIFEKGFTGSNGRRMKELQEGNMGGATGMGLYLCRKLCMKMEISIHATSEEGEYTRIFLTFPKTDFRSNLSNL